MQMFCQASAHLRCALLQGNSQVLYKPECVFITHLRMASWRAQLPKHASALQSVHRTGSQQQRPIRGTTPISACLSFPVAVWRLVLVACMATFLHAR